MKRFINITLRVLYFAVAGIVLRGLLPLGLANYMKVHTWEDLYGLLVFCGASILVIVASFLLGRFLKKGLPEGFKRLSTVLSRGTLLASSGLFLYMMLRGLNLDAWSYGSNAYVFPSSAMLIFFSYFLCFPLVFTGLLKARKLALWVKEGFSPNPVN